MGRFNATKYDPGVDSTHGHDKLRQSLGIPSPSVVLVRQEGHCPCGCGGFPIGAKSSFVMGHDARYRGKLIRAHIADVPVYIVRGDARNRTTDGHKAIDLAREFGWERYLLDAATRQAAKSKVELASRNLLQKAVGPQVGDRKVVKIGRWKYTGQVAVISKRKDNVGGYEVEYVTKSGGTRRAVCDKNGNVLTVQKASNG